MASNTNITLFLRDVRNPSPTRAAPPATPDDFAREFVLADEDANRFLPLEIRGEAGAALRADRAGASNSPAWERFDATLRDLPGPIIHVELVGGGPRGWLKANAIVRKVDQQVEVALAQDDAVVLARRAGAPIQCTPEALAGAGIRRDETPADAEGLEWFALVRMLRGFDILGRPDDAIALCKRMIAVYPPALAERWYAELGQLYVQKGWLKSAVGAFHRGISWFVRLGYLSRALEYTRKMAAIDLSTLPECVLSAPAVIEDFESEAFNNEWWAGGEVVAAPGRSSGRAYRLLYEKGENWFMVVLGGKHEWKGARAISFEACHEPHGEAHSGIEVGFHLRIGGAATGTYAAPNVSCPEGWSRHVIPLNEPLWSVDGRPRVGIDADPLGPVEWIQFFPAGTGRENASTIAFTNIRLE